MKVLHVMSYSPEPPVFGGALRVHHMLKHLAQHHDVTAVCFGTADDYRAIRSTFNSHLNEVYIVPYSWAGRFRRLGQLYSHWTENSYIQLVCRSDKMQRTLDRILFENDYDLVQMEFCMMGNYDLKTDAIRVLDAHNVEYDNYRRMAEHATTWLRRKHYLHEYRKLLREEIQACRRQDAVFVTSARDKQILDADVPDVPKFVVPNGVDMSYFTSSSESPEPYSIVFTGMMGYVPNYDGVLHFLDEILPLIRRSIPQIKVYIVGSQPPEILRRRASENVVVTGFVPDVRPYVWKSSAYVVPLRMGGGTRLKVLEAMAMKKPIISTSIGCEGIDVTDGEHLVVANEPAAFANAVVEVLRDARIRKHLTDNGYELARSKYKWNVICSLVEDIYQKLVYPTIGPAKGDVVYGKQHAAV